MEDVKGASRDEAEPCEPGRAGYPPGAMKPKEPVISSIALTVEPPRSSSAASEKQERLLVAGIEGLEDAHRCLRRLTARYRRADQAYLTWAELLKEISRYGQCPSVVLCFERRIALEFPAEEGQKLTPEYLQASIIPYLQALADMQHVIDEARGRPPSEVAIKSISQASPVTVAVDGIADAYKALTEDLVPWKRDHAQEMAKLAEREKQVELALKEAESLERRAHAATQEAEAEKLRAEATKLAEEARMIALENETRKLKLLDEKMLLAERIIEKTKPGLSKKRKGELVAKLLPSVDTLISEGAPEPGPLPAPALVPYELLHVTCQDLATDRAPVGEP